MVKAVDDFNRADGPLGVTPVGGLPWADVPPGVGGTDHLAVGSYAISGGTAVCTGTDGTGDSFIGYCAVMVDTGEHDGVVKLTVAHEDVANDGGDNFQGVLFRARDKQNFWAVIKRSTETFYYLNKCTPTGQHLIPLVPSDGVAHGDGDLLEVHLTGDLIETYVNGVLVGSRTDSVGAGDTGYGLYFMAGGFVTDAALDDFSFLPPFHVPDLSGALSAVTRPGVSLFPALPGGL